MAKTLSDLIADWRQHIAQPDATNSQFTDAQGTIWGNDAYRMICQKIRHLPIKIRDYTVASQNITLNSETIDIDDAKILSPDALNSDGTNKYQTLTIIGLADLLAMDPAYENATADVPTYLVRTGTFAAVLYPPPKASVIALTTPLRTYGLENPTALSANTDTPDLPGNLHDLIPHWMAYRSFAFLNDQAKVQEHLTLWNSRLKDNKGLATQFSRQTGHWRYEAET